MYWIKIQRPRSKSTLYKKAIIPLPHSPHTSQAQSKAYPLPTSTISRHLHAISALPFLLVVVLLLLAFPSDAQPSSVPLHDIIGKNLTSANLYFIRNYTIGSYSGKGPALYARAICRMYVGFTGSETDTGIPVRLTPGNPNATVIYPGERFKISLQGVEPACSRSVELGIMSRYVVTLGVGATETYFSVAVDDFGRYSLQDCGPCLACKNLCTNIGGYSLFYTGAAPFNFYFQKKVQGSFEPLQTQ